MIPPSNDTRDNSIQGADTVFRETKNRRVLIYWATGLGLTLAYVLMRGSQWQGSGNLHTAMEVISTTLAFTVGAMGLKRYWATRDSVFLFVGTAFIGTGMLDGYHALVTSAWVKVYLPSDLPALIPWSWVASRMFLAFTLFIGVLLERREQKLGMAGQIDPSVVYVSTAVMTFTSFLFFAFVPLPRAYYPELIFHRPEEFVPAFFFGLTLILHLKKGHWHWNRFEHWLIVCLIVNLVGQAVFMSFSGKLFDLEFDTAHSLKKVSYICVLIGLCITLRSASKERLAAWTDFRDRLAKASNSTQLKGFGIGRKVSLLITSCVVLSFATTGVIVQMGFNRALIENGHEGMRRNAHWISIQLIQDIQRLGKDAHDLSTTPPIRGIIRAIAESGTDTQDLSSLEQWNNQFSALASNQLESERSYNWVRYFSFGEDGRELVGVQRKGDAIETTTFNASSPSSEQTLAALELPSEPGLIGYTDIISQDRSWMLNASIVVHGEDSEPFGAIVLQKDFGRAFADLLDLAIEGSQVYLTDSSGNVLLARSGSGTIAKDKSAIGTRIQDRYPEIEQFLTSNLSNTIQSSEVYQGVRNLFAAEKVYYDPSDKSRYIVIFEEQSYDNILAPVINMLKQVLFGGLLVMMVTLILALIFTNTITAPLVYIARSIFLFGKGQRLLDLPVNAKDETGVLARAFRDMSEQVRDRADRLEKEVSSREKAQNKLKYQNEEMEQLMYTVSHDLKSPLVTVQGFAGMLEKHVSKGNIEKALDSVGRIQRATKHMGDLIGDLLELSRVGRIEDRTENLNMDKTLASLSDILDGPLKQAKAKLVIEENLPELKVGKKHILQVFQNLIANAIKYGCVEPGKTVTVGANVTPEETLFFVKDEGPGIPPEYHERIFILFQRLDMDKEGTGLGLAIVSKIIRMYSGRVWVESESNNGCIFWLAFPKDNETEAISEPDHGKGSKSN